MRNRIEIDLSELEVEALSVSINVEDIISNLDADDIINLLDDRVQQEIAGQYIAGLDGDEARELLRDAGHLERRHAAPTVEMRGTHLPHVMGVYVDDEVQGVIITSTDGAYVQLWSGTAYAVGLLRFDSEAEAHRVAKWIVLGQWAHQEA